MGWGEGLCDRSDCKDSLKLCFVYTHEDRLFFDIACPLRFPLHHPINFLSSTRIISNLFIFSPIHAAYIAPLIVTGAKLFVCWAIT